MTPQYSLLRSMLCIIYLVNFLLFSALDCFSSATPLAPEALKSLRVVMDDNYPPYVFRDEQGELKGITIDQWRLWEKKTGIRVELNAMDWSEAQRRMQNGEFDVIDTIFRNEKREKIYDFTKPYAVIPVPLFFHSDISGIRGPKDLKGFVVAAKSGGNVLDVLKKNGVTSIVEYPSYEKIIAAARDGSVKVFTVDRPAALYFLNKMGIQDQFRETAPMYSGEFHRAVLKGRGHLLSFVEEGFAKISADDFKAIDTLWMGTSVSGISPFRYVWYVVGVAGALGIVALIWLILLRRAVKHKTVELAESEKRYRSIIENLQDVYYRSDAEGRLVMLSPSGVQLLGYDNLEQMLGCNIRDTFYHDPEERDAYLHNLKMKGTLYGYEVTLKRKDGTPLPVASSAHVLFDATDSFMGVEGVFRDITSQRKADEALRASEQTFSTAFSQAPLLMTFSDIQSGRYLEVNNRFCEISGFSQSEAVGQTSIELGWISVTQRDRLLEILNRDGRVQDTEVPLTAKDGHPVICLYSAEIINVNGVDQLLSIAQDITQRKKDLDALDYANECFRQALSSPQHILYRLNVKKGCYDYLSPIAETITGHPLAQLMQTSLEQLRDYFHPDDCDRIFGIMGEKSESRTGNRFNMDLEYRFRKADDSYCWLHDSNTACFDGQGELEFIFGTAHDISDRILLQQEREKAQRLSSLGILAGGIAHDFNNILTGIIGNISIAAMLVGQEHRAAERLKQSQDAARRAADLTQQLLTFSRGGEPLKQMVDVSRLIDEAIAFCLRGSNSKADFVCTPDLWPIDADAGQINQVLNNLLINARQAMEGGGTVHVYAENYEMKIGDLQMLATGRYVRIIVKDEGCGISVAELGQIFDPYFTTKETGTGLGLTSVYSIVQRHGGQIEVTSEVGEGTTFTLYLPAVADVIENEPVLYHQEGLLTGNGKILVMDDDEIIRDLAVLMLEEVGYLVECCADGAEAIDCFMRARQAGNPFDAMILDLTVPGGMGGKAVASVIREQDQNIVMIVSSGYSNDPVVADFRSYGFNGVVSKPYNIESLTGELARLLSGRRTVV